MPSLFMIKRRKQTDMIEYKRCENFLNCFRSNHNPLIYTLYKQVTERLVLSTNYLSYIRQYGQYKSYM